MPCVMITRSSPRPKVSKASGSARSRCCRIRPRCGRTLPARGDRTLFTSWSHRMPGDCRSSGPGEPRGSSQLSHHASVEDLDCARAELLSACDAAYLALTETLDCCPLLTGDARIGRAVGERCPITLLLMSFFPQMLRQCRLAKVE